MTDYLTELRGIGDWQARLGDPEKHWKRGASAMELAVDWLSARKEESGLPTAVRNLLDSMPQTRGLKLRLAVPERRTSLPGGVTASQSDLWALLERDDGFVSLIVEGKAREPFDKPVSEWLQTSTSSKSKRQSGKPERLEFLCEALGINPQAVGSIRYQLLHRSVAAILEARAWHAQTAVMLVQRFSATPDVPSESFADYQAFTRVWGVEAESGKLFKLGTTPRLLVGWIDVHTATDAQLLRVLAP